MALLKSEKNILLGIGVFFILAGILATFIYHGGLQINEGSDHFADDLKIPTDIEVNLPKDSEAVEASSSPSFDLYKGMEPGMYNVHVSVNPGQTGSIYIKAFEVTHNTPLSVQDLKSLIKPVQGNANPSDFFTYDAGIMIYEGNWGQPYAARFEVWFVPSSGPERMLMQKVYKIEGWER